MAATSIEIVTAKHSAPEQILKEAKRKSQEAQRENNAYEKIWLVFDHDNHPNRKAAYNNAQKESFNVVFSAFCFEIWYLLHFVKSARAFSDTDNLIKALKKYYPSYQKAKQNDFSFLKDYLEKAIVNAKWLREKEDNNESHITDYNPWIDVDLLINYLKSL